MKNKRFDRIIRRKSYYKPDRAVMFGKKRWYLLYDAPTYISLELMLHGKNTEVSINWGSTYNSLWRPNYSEYWRLDNLHSAYRRKRLTLPKRDHTGFSVWDPNENDRWKHPTRLESYYHDAAHRLQLEHGIVSKIMLKEYPAPYRILKYGGCIDIYTPIPKPNLTQEEMLKILLDFLMKKEDNLKTLY